ncbi:MAG: hypothetical protein ACJAW3_000733 [Lentimonas sp.]|jgi:hypothetical protein
MSEIYRKKRNEFLDEVLPDDLINGENFNQLGEIIDKINASYMNHKINQTNSDEFIKKATKSLFREDSSAIKKLINLVNIFADIK